jgi:hypothetical protein
MLVATTAVRRTKVPAPVAAVLLGGAAVALDSLLADLGERRQAATIAAVGSPDEADADAELGAEGEYEAEAEAADE